MAGTDSSLARILAKAKKGPTEGSSSAPPFPQPELNTNPQAAAEAGSKVLPPKAKKKRAKADETDGKAVDVPEGGESDRLKRHKNGNGPQGKPLPPWLDCLSEAAYDDPLLACREICQAASERLKRLPGLRQERDEAIARAEKAEELEMALEASKEKIRSSDKELHLAKEDLRLAGQKIEGLEGKISELQDEVRGLSTERDSLEEEKGGLESEVEILTTDAQNVVEESFKNALQQVEFCHPGLSIDRSIVHNRHVVSGDQIEFPQGKSDGTSLVI